MNHRAMIVVGGGASSRFGGDKLLTSIAGRPLVAHTVETVGTKVERCILVCRPDQMEDLSALKASVDLVPGADSRTGSELAGLTALEDSYELIGIHDAARPLVSSELIDQLFAAAEEHGGAVPLVDPNEPVVDRSALRPIAVKAAQTPQVFRSGALRAAYAQAKAEGVEGHDTAEIVGRYTDCAIFGVPGSPDNIKVTFREDLAVVEDLIRARAHTEPR